MNALLPDGPLPVPAIADKRRIHDPEAHPQLQRSLRERGMRKAQVQAQLENPDQYAFYVPEQGNPFLTRWLAGDTIALIGDRDAVATTAVV